ncbi:short-chain dehydrogenase [Hydrogenophaga crassostreae]|uniref:Short-chain dehydrogenase n=1 Tax=Hydrogenophaga crassostreae TaxID=1763535 RepID=A0A167GJD3_9BURK|nr:NnrS family protein [Hydrogenophaga crassostreae]AOW15074.1 short-chain dehydrogenase [Hydrogenophaga crassostreae]OAD39527.1 short-chain dehydrogenase [Hydrogenophaga crassostreae]
MSEAGAPKRPPLRVNTPRPASGRPHKTQTPQPWRLRHLLLAPHRLGFFLAMGLLLASGLWWALVQLDRATGWLGLGYAVSPTLTHAALMSLGFIPLFFSGFLFTAGPNWLGVAKPEARDLLTSSGLQAGGWLIWLAGAHTHGGLAVAGVLLAACGLGLQTWRFWGLVRASTQADRLHAKVVAVAAGVGMLSVVGIAAATAFDAVDIALAFVLSGLWGFVVPTYLAVAHRMIPFFTSSAVPMVHAWRPFWVLWAMLAAAGLEWVSVWLPVFTGSPPRGWMLFQGLAELAAGGVLIWLGVAWGLVQSLKVRLLAMLHLGFVWLGLSFVLAGASELLGLQAGVPALGLGALHALTMGCLGSLLLAMVTRVACGHSGRPLVADNLVWGLFLALQLAVLLRIAGALPQAPPGVLVAAALVWAGVVTVWGIRLMGWFGRPRADGRPG